MKPSRGSGDDAGQAHGHAALGFQFAGGVLVFLGLGWLVDRWLNLMPVFTVTGALLGAVLGFLSVYYQIRREDEARRGKDDR